MKRLFLTQLCSQLLGSAADARLCRPHPQGRERRATYQSTLARLEDLIGCTIMHQDGMMRSPCRRCRRAWPPQRRPRKSHDQRRMREHHGKADRHAGVSDTRNAPRELQALNGRIGTGSQLELSAHFTPA